MRATRNGLVANYAFASSYPFSGEMQVFLIEKQTKSGPCTTSNEIESE